MLAFVLLLAFDVDAWSIVRFAAYEVAFVLAPGIALYGVIPRRKPRILEWLAIGIALGYALEIFAFMAVSEVGARWAFWLYPPIAIGAALLIGRRRGWPASPDLEGASRGPANALAAICAVGLIFLAAGTWTQSPFPGDFEDAAITPDQMYYLGLAADAEHHWPMTPPQVSGSAYNTYEFAFARLAAPAWITGVDMSQILFRLYLVPLYLAAVLLLALLGRQAGVGPWAGPLAAGIFLLSGELDLSPFQSVPLGDSRMIDFQEDPTWGYGLLFFTGSIALVAGFLRSKVPMGAGRWAVFVALMIAAAGTKGATVPILLGGLVALFAVQTLRHRRVASTEAGFVAVALAVYFASSLLYGGESSLVSFDPLTLTREMRPIDVFSGKISGGLSRAVFWAFSVPLSTIALFAAPIFGTALLLVFRNGRLTAPQSLFVALFATSLLPFFLLSTILGGLASIPSYGQVMLAAVGAAGLELAGMRIASRGAGAWRPVLLIAGAWLVALIGASLVPYYVRDWYEFALYNLWYAVPAFGLVAGVIALVAAPRIRAPLATVMILGFLAYSALDLPIDRLAPVIERASANLPLHARSTETLRGVSDEVTDGILFVREHSTPADVLAVNNFHLDKAGRDARYFYYSGFSERRVFLEGWDYSAEGHRLQDIAGQSNVPKDRNPFPERKRLNDAAFEGDRRAIRRLADRFGVRYLLVDLRFGQAALGLRRLAMPAFSNRQVEVYGTRDLLTR